MNDILLYRNITQKQTNLHKACQTVETRIVFRPASGIATGQIHKIIPIKHVLFNDFRMVLQIDTQVPIQRRSPEDLFKYGNELLPVPAELSFDSQYALRIGAFVEIP